MAKLSIDIVGINVATENIMIDGKRPKLVKNGAGRRSCVIETDKSEVEVSICHNHYYNGKNWFWWNLLFFIVSIFGIFDIYQNTRFLVVDCRFKLAINGDTNVELQIQNFEDGGKLLEVVSDNNVEILENKQFYDKEAQKRHKIMKKAKIGIVFGVILLVSILMLIFK